MPAINPEQLNRACLIIFDHSFVMSTINGFYLVSVHKVPFAALRLSENCSFTISKLRVFGPREPCKWNLMTDTWPVKHFDYFIDKLYLIRFRTLSSSFTCLNAGLSVPS